MKSTATFVHPQSPTTPPGVPTRRQLIRWDNPVAINDGYSVYTRLVNGQQIGQFCMCPVYITDMDGNWEGTWAENQMATPLSNAEMLKISQLQVADEYSINQKMNWLMWGGTNTWGGPMKATYPNGDKWMEAINIKMITAVYAGQWVEVLERKTLMIDFGGITELTPMSRIKTYPPSEWSNPNTTQIVTAVNRDNVYNEKPKGTVRLPIYFGNRLGWVFDRWFV